MYVYIYEHLYSYAFCIEVHCRKSFHIIEWWWTSRVCVWMYAYSNMTEWKNSSGSIENPFIWKSIHFVWYASARLLAYTLCICKMNQHTTNVCYTCTVHICTYIYLMNSKFSINGRRRVNLRAMHHQHFSRGTQQPRYCTWIITAHQNQIYMVYTQKKSKLYETLN